MLFTVVQFLCGRARCVGYCCFPRALSEKRNKRLILVAAVMVTVLLATQTNIISVSTQLVENLDIHCDQRAARYFLDELCVNYSKGYVVGSLCPALCQPGDTSARAQFRRLAMATCLSHGNKIVLEMVLTRGRVLEDQGHGGETIETVILKAVSFSGDRHREKMPLAPDERFRLKDLVEHVAEHLNSVVQPERISKEDLRRFLVDFNIFSSPQVFNDFLTAAQLHSALSLLTQDEFVMLMLLRHSGAVPSLIGSCGHAYAVTSIRPSSFASLMRSVHINWPDRVLMALGFFALESSFSHTPFGQLNLCDVKPDNFGVRRPDTCSGVRDPPLDDHKLQEVPPARRKALFSADCHQHIVQAIDIDIVFFPGQMQQILGQGECKMDTDCQFYDCHARCNVPKGICADNRSNSNIQAICSKIFVGSPRLSGLLWNAPLRIRRPLQRALIECADPEQLNTIQNSVSRILRILMDEQKRIQDYL